MFKRSGVDIHSDLLISVAQAILGGTATTPGLYQTISVVVRSTEVSLSRFTVLINTDTELHCSMKTTVLCRTNVYPLSSLDSFQLPSRSGDSATGERHSQDEQLQLWRSLRSHQDQSTQVRDMNKHVTLCG